MSSSIEYVLSTRERDRETHSQNEMKRTFINGLTGIKKPSIFIKEQPRLVDKQNRKANILHNNACTPRRPCGNVLYILKTKERDGSNMRRRTETDVLHPFSV